MLFSCSGSSSARNRRIVVIEEEDQQQPGERPSPVQTPGTAGPESGSVAQPIPSSSFGSGQGYSNSCPESFITSPAHRYTPQPDRPATRSGSSRTSSRTEVLIPGKWTSVTPLVRLRALTTDEQKTVFETQKTEHLLYKPKAAQEAGTVTKMDEGVDGTGTQNLELAQRVPDSPGSRSNFGEFYWDTNGENVYHISDSYDSDLLLEIDNYGKGTSAARLDRAQEDLNKYRQRIDANVEHQKEYADMMAALQQKVQEYRRHIADLENRIAVRRPDEPSFTIIDPGAYPDGKYKDDISWSPRRGLDDATEYQLLSKLDEERRKVDDFRIQLEQERIQNDQLLHENERLRQQFEVTMSENERIYKTRERNLAQYLSDEQKKMMDLWSELQRVRKQLGEHREKTEHDLESQKNEFVRVLRNVGGLTRQLNLTGADAGSSEPLLTDSGRPGNGTTLNQDVVLIEAIKRIRGDQQSAQPNFQLLNELKLASSASHDGDLYNELIKKYEECIERNVELESKGDEAQRRTATLEAELRRTKEHLAENQVALRKLHELAKDKTRGSDRDQRARSLSPSGTSLPPAEALRSVRNIMHKKDNEIQQLQRQLKVIENQVKDYMNKFDHADEARRQLDKHLTECRRDLANQIKTKDEMERQMRRLEERLRNAESERLAAEKAKKNLEEEINRLHQQYQKASEDEGRKARDKEQEINLSLEGEYRNRINELMRRIENLQQDNNKMKSEMNLIRNKCRDIESEYNITLRKLEEKDSALRHLDELKRNLATELDKQRTHNNGINAEFDRLRNEFENNNKTISTKEHALREIKQQRDDFSKQKDELSRQLFDLKHSLENERSAHEEAEKMKAHLMEEMEKMKLQITDCEYQLNMLRRHNDELDTQIKSGQAKTTTLENDLITGQKENSKLIELNSRLQREKQDAINQKLKADSEIDVMKEQIKKLEADLDKLRNENRAVLEQESKTREALTHQTNRTHLLQRELEEAKTEIEELERRIKRLEQELADRVRGTIRNKSSEDDSVDKISVGPGGPTIHDTEIHEIRIKEINDRWKLDFDKLLGEKDELEQRIRELEDQIAQNNREAERQASDLAEIRRKHQAEVDKLNSEISRLFDKHQNDLDDEKEQYAKNLESIKLVEDELRDRLNETERKLAEAENRENMLDRDARDLKERYEAALAQLEKLKDDLEDTRQAADTEIQKWKTDAYTAHSELKTLETANSALKAQLNATNDRAESLNKTVNEQTARIRELNNTIRHLEEEMTDLKSTLTSRESDLENTLGRLRSIEEAYASLQLDHSKAKNELDLLQREYDLIKGANVNNENELDRLKKRIQQAELALKEQRNAFDRLRSEREKLQNAYRDKAKQADHLNQLAQSFDTKLDKMRHDLRSTTDKLLTAENERNTLRSEIEKLQQELQFGKDQMVRKTDEYQSSLEDLANAHRAAEDGRLNALQELESRKYELADIKSRLENTEQRLSALQQDYNNVESERDITADILRRFQSVTSHAVSLHKLRDDSDREKIGDTEIPRSIPFPPLIDYTTTGGTRTGGTTINIGESLDINQLESTLQKLIDRIGKLERERNEYREALDRLKKKTSDTHVTISKRETKYKTIEENLNDLEEEKRGMEVRLTSAKQLLRSQEEALKQRDDERRQLKSKVVAADLELRGKEAQIRHLNEQLKNLRNDLDNAYTDVRTLRDHEERWESSRFQLESQLRDKESENTKLNLLMTNLENDKQTLSERTKELAGQVQINEIKFLDMKEDLERMKRELAKAEIAENELRKTSEQQTQSINEYQILREQVVNTQNDLLNANNLKQQLENELAAIRAELREHKQRVYDLNGRANDLQRQLQDSNMEKNRLEERVISLEKANASQRASEDELKRQLDGSKNEKKIVQRELDELHQKLSQIEHERKSILQQLENTKRERNTFLKKIELMENEKRRTDAAVRETILQREAIEKSLNAMERENKELYKNCAQLQQQIAQLEFENGNRIMELTSKQREEQDRQMQRLKNEKIHIERIIESRERTQANRIKQLENQLNIMRTQLDNERKRRREYVDRNLAGDIGKLGGRYLGLRPGGIHSAGVLPSLGDDYLRNSRYPRNTFASNPLTPPLGTSTPTQLNDTQLDSYMATSSYHPSLIGSTIGDERIELLEPSREITETSRISSSSTRD